MERLAAYWDKQAGRYDREMDRWDRRLFGDSRPWVCGRALGDVLEVAVGTGRNFPFYPDGVRLTAVDWSPVMLGIARKRAAALGREADLRPGDAQALDFPDGSFDTVLCALGLCAIPDDRRAVTEMARVLRPGGRLLLVDHVAASARALRAAQWLYERISIPLAGEHFRRRPLTHVRELGFLIEETERLKLGIVERACARKAKLAPLRSSVPETGIRKEPDVRRDVGRDRHHPRRWRGRDRGLPGPADEPGAVRRRGGDPSHAGLRRGDQGNNPPIRGARL